jgi:ABC-2 type transport system permease protein
MAGLGALVPNMREGSQATMIVILPLIIPLIFISSLIDSPNSALSIGLSLFPLTSPVAMMSRLAGGGVPFWQPALAVLLLILTAYFIVQAVARMFRAQNLLSGQTVNAKRYFLALLGK